MNNLWRWLGSANEHPWVTVSASAIVLALVVKRYSVRVLWKTGSFELRPYDSPQRDDPANPAQRIESTIPGS